MNTIKYLKPNSPSIIEENTVWSKEDEEMFVKIGEAIDSYYAPFSSDAEDMSNWFKSLKQRYIWKPTKEEMETIEEKARAYDEAIVRAKAMIKVAANQDEAMGFVNTIFPELKESEDEKIRKRIIQAIKIREKEMNEEWSNEIAWLEKQGENHVNIDIDEMVDKFTRTELKFDGTLCAVVDAYRKGITDALIKQNLL